MSERNHEERLVAFDASNVSNEIRITPGATFSVYLDAAFAGATLTVEGILPRNKTKGEPEVWKEINDPAGEFPVAVTADRINILPTGLYSTALERIRLKSNVAETCTGFLFLRE